MTPDEQARAIVLLCDCETFAKTGTHWSFCLSQQSKVVVARVAAALAERGRAIDGLITEAGRLQAEVMEEALRRATAEERLALVALEVTRVPVSRGCGCPTHDGGGLCSGPLPDKLARVRELLGLFVAPLQTPPSPEVATGRAD